MCVVEKTVTGYVRMSAVLFRIAELEACAFRYFSVLLRIRVEYQVV